MDKIFVLIGKCFLGFAFLIYKPLISILISAIMSALFWTHKIKFWKILFVFKNKKKLLWRVDQSAQDLVLQICCL